MADSMMSFDVFRLIPGRFPDKYPSVELMDTVFYPKGTTLDSAMNDITQYYEYGGPVIVKLGADCE